MAFTPDPNVVVVNPTDAAAITNAAYRAAGYGVSGATGGWSMTPNSTGRILLIATGVVTGGGAGTATLQLISGTGAAPANAASTGLGTAAGGQPAIILDAGGLQAAFALTWVLTNQTLNTAVWFDIQQKMSANSLQLQFANLIAIEL